VLLQNPDDLLFRKAIALHALVLVVGQSELQTGLSPWGKVTRSSPVISRSKSPHLFGANFELAERDHSTREIGPFETTARSHWLLLDLL
jgi:hypothetical protein